LMNNWDLFGELLSSFMIVFYSELDFEEIVWFLSF